MHINKQNSYEISDFKFHYELNTRWKDMDVFGHVNNAVILTYIEDARITFFKRWNLKIQKKALILASVKIDYLHQITHPSNLIVGQRISRIGNKSGTYEKARNSKINKWVNELEGWKWWFYQIVVCGFFFIIIEVLLNLVGLTMLPWK